jgi:hypothetical protein
MNVSLTYKIRERQRKLNQRLKSSETNISYIPFACLTSIGSKVTAGFYVSYKCHHTKFKGVYMKWRKCRSHLRNYHIHHYGTIDWKKLEKYGGGVASYDTMVLPSFIKNPSNCSNEYEGQTWKYKRAHWYVDIINPSERRVERCIPNWRSHICHRSVLHLLLCIYHWP